MEENLQKIYQRMDDPLSREIFIDRLNYSVTHEYHYLEKMVDRTVRNSGRWKKFCGILQDRAQLGDIYLFGAGIWGNTLYKETKGQIQWRGVIDNQPKGKVMADLEIMTLEQFMERCNDNTTVVISSYKNGQEMSAQLRSGGIKQDSIIDAGTVIYWLTEGAVYFDLEQLYPQADFETFVDAGCFDGLTTQAFFQWCKTKGYAYCFEPDGKNAEVVRKNLINCAGRHELAEKALWSTEMDLCIDERGNCASSVREDNGTSGSPMTAAVALDDYLAGKQVTYIKMDVEGAEAEVLKGARNTITCCRPRLAVSIYHRTEDIFALPELILTYYPGYRFYMRHYSFSDYDTVLYAVP